MFVPFCNKDYTNTWGDRLETSPASLDEYYKVKHGTGRKRGHCRRENIIPDKTRWWANGNIICNEHSPPGQRFTQYWGDHLLIPMKDMIEAACRRRQLPDAEVRLGVDVCGRGSASLAFSFYVVKCA